MGIDKLYTKVGYNCLFQQTVDALVVGDVVPILSIAIVYPVSK
jgi:hypothetical protein